MKHSLRNPLSVLAALSGVSMFILMLARLGRHWLMLNPRSYAWEFGGPALLFVESGGQALALILAIGMVLCCEQRRLPIVVCTVAVIVRPAQFVGVLLPETSVSILLAIGCVVEVAFLAVWVAVAAVHTDRARAVAGVCGLLAALSISEVGLRLTDSGSEFALIAVSLLEGVAGMTAMALIAVGARAASSVRTWPIALLGLLPLARIWFLSELWMATTNRADSVSSTFRWTGVEVVLATLAVVAFVFVHRRGVETRHVVAGTVLGSALRLLVVPMAVLGLAVQPMYLQYLSGLALLVNTAVLVLSVVVLRDIAMRDEQDFPVLFRVMLGSIAVVSLCSLGLQWGVVSPPALWLVYLPGVLALAAVLAWSAVCFRLVHRLDIPLDEQHLDAV